MFCLYFIYLADSSFMPPFAQKKNILYVKSYIVSTGIRAARAPKIYLFGPNTILNRPVLG